MSGLTHLESAVLNAICQYNGECGKALCALLPDLTVKNRENTGHGFYSNLDCKRSHSPVHPASFSMDGPIAYMSNMGDGMIMSFILWLEDGYPDCLEGYQYGDNAGNTVDLKEIDLASLEFTRLEPHPK